MKLDDNAERHSAPSSLFTRVKNQPPKMRRMRFMHRIRSLKANVSLEEAKSQFAGGSLSKFTRDLAFGPLRSVAAIHIPFRLFEVAITNGGSSQTEFFALDVVNGTLDVFRFDSVPDTELVESRNVLDVAVDDNKANDLVLSAVRRALYSHGFFKMRDLHLKAAALPGDLYAPYWVGLRGRSQDVHLEVLDAVRRRMEGGKMRQMVSEWLLSASASLNR